MKKYLIGVLLLGVLAFNVPKVHAVTIDDLYKEIQGLKEQVNLLKTQINGKVLGDTTTITSILYKGTSGTEVKTIQSALTSEGYLRDKVDGIFGSKTETAVKSFQTASGLPVTGVVDANTRSSILGIPEVSTTTSFLDGCDRTTKYSATTGRACDGSQETTPVLLPDCKPDSSPHVTIISPNGNEVYSAGEQVTVKWKSCNVVGNVTIQLQMPTMPHNPGIQLAPALLGGTPNDGQEIVTLPTLDIWPNMQFGQNFKVAITDIPHNVLDYSDNLFTINSSTGCGVDAIPSVTVLSPNGGEVYQAGQQVEVKWTSCGVPGNIAEINLLDVNGWGGGTGVNLDKDLPNTGSYTVTLPDTASFLGNNVQFGKYFKIELVAVGTNNSTTKDSSDNLFTINDINGDFPDGCSSNSNFSLTTGMACSSGSHLISYWWGKVNQHTNPGPFLNLNKWETDPDGVSGANLDMLTYCKKWFPNTTSVVPFMNQTLVDWHERGNINNWTSTKMAYSCL